MNPNKLNKEEKKNRKRLRDKKRYEENKVILLAQSKLRKEKNKERNAELNKIYHQKNKDLIKERKQKWYLENKENIKLTNKNWRVNNQEHILEYQRKYFNEKMISDENFRFKNKIRKLIRYSFKKKNHNKSSTTTEILGCSYNDFKLYIETLWEPWMNWNNYGLYNGEPNYGWDIDHIIPLKESSNIGETIKLNHHSNLQPLCSYINRDVKIDKLISP